MKLEHLSEWNTTRQQAASWYNDLLNDIKTVQYPVTRSEVEHVLHLYVVQVEQRDNKLETLKQVGIGAETHYPMGEIVGIQYSHEHLI